MDCRLTIGEKDTFLEMLTWCMNNAKKADMMIDVNGLSRASGFVQSISREEGRYFVKMDTEEIIDLETVVAVNGVFAAEYSGC